MTAERRMKLMWRWSLVTAAVIALFWTIWYLIAGQVPVVTSLKLTDSWTYVLPFGISRWWDVVFGPVWITILILLLTNKKIKENKDLSIVLVAGLVALFAALGIALSVALVAGLGAALVATLGAVLVAGLGASLVVGLGVGLGWLGRCIRAVAQRPGTGCLRKNRE